MSTYLRYCFVVLLFLNTHTGLAYGTYTLDDSIRNTIGMKKGNIPSCNLFLHTDKNIYTNNEQIWFSGFLNGDSALKLNQHTTLFVTIKDKYNRNILQECYLMVDGLSFGCLQLSDSIPPGNYHIIAHTNIVDQNMQPVAYFQSPLKIKYIKNDAMSVDFKILDDSSSPRMFNLQLTAKEKNGMPVKGARVSYICNEKEISSGTTDKLGNKTISIDKDLISKGSVLITLKGGNSIQYLQVPFQRDPVKKVNIEFYPEGGKISMGLLNTIGWVAKSSNGQPLKITGILLEDNLAIDTVETESYGIGKFTFVRKARSSYKLKVVKNRFQDVDTIYDLPEASKDALALRINQAVTNDTLELSITSRDQKHITLLVHNYNNVFGKVKLALQPLITKKVKVAVLDVPKGINTISILDSLDMSLAERDFFSAYNSGIKQELVVPKTVYNKKERVNVKLILKNDKGDPVQGLVSIACVQSNRISGNIKNDIETYTYLTSVLGTLPLNDIERPYLNKAYLENLLLIGRQRNSGKESVSHSSDMPLNLHSVEFEGHVTRFGEKLKKGVKLTILRDSVVEIIQTKQDGSFYLSAENMITPYGKKISILVSEKNMEGYHITLKSPEFNLKELGINDFQNLEFKDYNNAGDSQKDELSVSGNINQLNEVVIKGKKDNAIFESFSSAYQGNTCGDYVAICNGLNCHLPGHNYQKKAPIKGWTYIKHVIINNRIVSNIPMVYSGCVDKPKTNVFTFDGVYMTKEFYGISESNSQSIDASYLSTIYWNPGVIIEQDGTATFSFITSDISGRFSIVVDGVGTNGVVHVEKEFTVN